MTNRDQVYKYIHSLVHREIEGKAPYNKDAISGMIIMAKDLGLISEMDSRILGMLLWEVR